MVEGAPGRKPPLLDLFSGVGGLSLALGGVFRTVAYCDSSPAAQAVLKNNMAAGRLDRGPVFGDVATLTARDLPTPPVALTAGFPCQDASLASPVAAVGIKGERTGLVRHVLRLARELSGSLKIIFLENVPNFINTGMDQVVSALHRLGFRVAYGTFSASSVGASHQRRRWFCLAVKPGYERRLGAPPAASTTADFSERVPRFRKRTVTARRGMLRRCSLLGNAVVPQCAAHAYARLLQGLKGAARGAAGGAAGGPAGPHGGGPHLSGMQGAVVVGKGAVVVVQDTPLRSPRPLTVVIDCADGGGDCGTVVRHSWNTPMANVGRLRSLGGSKRRVDELVNQVFYDRVSQQYLRRRMGYTGAIARAEEHYIINPTWVEHLMGYPTDWTDNDWTSQSFGRLPK
jgi:hypothetical protein